MAPSQLFDALSELPSRPFRIHITDGSYYDIRHPDFCLVGMRTSAVWVKPADPEDPDRYVKIDNRHITRLEPLPSPAKAPLNGPGDS
jgi:hypothetical protein